MNKKAQEGPGLIVVLIAGIIVIAVGIGIYIGISSYLSSRSNIEAVQTWVNLRAASGGADIAVSETPPVIELEKPLKINSEDDLRWNGNEPPKAFKEMADSMVDCWSAFGKGEKDFIHSTEKELFCFPCRAVIFSDEIKRNNIKVVGLNRYLNDQHTRGKDSPTYMQILANDNTYSISAEELQDDELIIDDDIYVFFFAASGKEWTKLVGQSVYSLGNLVLLGIPELIFGDPDEIVELEQPQQQQYLPTQLGSETAAVITPGEDTGIQEITQGTTVAGASATTIIFKEEIGKRVTQGIAGTTEVGKVKFVAGEGYLLENVRIPKPPGKIAISIGKKLTKFLGSKLFFYISAGITVYEISSGVYNIYFNEKDFVAMVLLVNPKTINERCNA